MSTLYSQLYDSDMPVMVTPGWIWKHLSRQGLSLKDLGVFERVSHCLSVNDMAEWVYLNEKFKFNQYQLSNRYLKDTFEFDHDYLSQQSRTLDESYWISVSPLSGSQEIADNVQARLTKATTDDGPGYEVHLLADRLYIMLHEGFLLKHAQRDAVLQFTKTCLKKCYEVAPVHKANRLSLFKLYVEQLS